MFSAADSVLGLGEPQRVGRFRFYLDGERKDRSDTVARMHGYEPGEVEPNTELLLRHKHPDDRERVAAILDRVPAGEPFSSRHRIIDTAGRTREPSLWATGCSMGTAPSLPATTR